MLIAILKTVTKEGNQSLVEKKHKRRGLRQSSDPAVTYHNSLRRRTAVVRPDPWGVLPWASPCLWGR